MQRINRKVSKENAKPKQWIYPFLKGMVLIPFILSQFSDALQQECGHFTDAMIMLILAILWVSQPQHLRYRDVASMTAILIVTKLSYFVDREKSLNFNNDPVLQEWKFWL